MSGSQSATLEFTGKEVHHGNGRADVLAGRLAGQNACVGKGRHLPLGTIARIINKSRP